MALEFLSNIPTYVYWLVGLVIFVVIYLVLSDDNKAIVRRFLKTFGFWIVLVLGYIYFRDKLGFFGEEDFFGRQANTYATLIILAYLLGKAYIGSLRYRTNQFIADGLHGSFSEYPLETENGFLVFSIGGIRASGINVERGNQIAVIRKETGQFMGTNFVSIAHMKKVPKERLPPEVVDAISSYNHLKGLDEIYYGWFDSQKEEDYVKNYLKELSEWQTSDEFNKMLKEEVGLKNPTLGDLTMILEKFNAAYNKLFEQYTDVTRSTEAQASHYKRLRKTFDDSRPRRPPSESENDGGY